VSTRVAVFTDNDFVKTNGVTTALRALVAHAPPGIEPRIYTCADLGVNTPEYLAFASHGIGIPFYKEMRMYAPPVAKFRHQLRDDGIGLVHVTTPGPIGLAARHLARARRVPLVGSFHTHLAEYTAVLSGSPGLGRLMGAYTRWLYETCETVFVPSADTARRLATQGWQLSKLVLWTRGVDTAVFDPARRSDALRVRWAVSEERPAILYAGRLSREKGLSLLQDVARRLAAHGRAYRFVFVGDGPMAGELRRRFPDAMFTGTLPHDGVAAAMASADVFVFPSETDTAGNVVLEAQASGLPVLVTDRGGPLENMVDAVTGYVCRGGDATSFGDRVLDLLSDPDLRTAMGRAARQYALTRSWTRALQPVYDRYRVLARGRVTDSHTPGRGTPAAALSHA
jgi:glycosyltransferase involved in cell wall biosynthesis